MVVSRYGVTVTCRIALGGFGNPTDLFRGSPDHPVFAAKRLTLTWRHAA